MKTASVVIVTYRRMTRLPEIVRAWMTQCGDVWLCDCSANGIDFSFDGLNVARFSPDPGNKVRHAVATLTSGDICIKADDDIMPLPGLVDDFLRWNNELGECITGIHGRTFEGPDYYNDTILYAAHKLDAPKLVDFLGVITCAPRQFLGMDLRGCETPIEDIYWHNHIYPHVPKYVIPTNAFNNKLPESRDEGRLCAGKEQRAIRRAYYKQVYEENYKR